MVNAGGAKGTHLMEKALAANFSDTNDRTWAIGHMIVSVAGEALSDEDDLHFTGDHFAVDDHALSFDVPVGCNIPGSRERMDVELSCLVGVRIGGIESHLTDGKFFFRRYLIEISPHKHGGYPVDIV